MISTASCSGRVENERKKLSSILGQEVVLPDSLACQIQDYPVKYDMRVADYKIVTCIDSVGCTPCKMKLPVWDELINKFKAKTDSEVSFLMIFNFSSDKGIDTNLNDRKFPYPVCFSTEVYGDVVNQLPSGDEYHTFLLDANNNIICVGNPVFNPKIRKLYEQIIIGEAAQEYGLVSNPGYALGIVHPNDTLTSHFLLVNRENHPITIQELVPSCDCVSATASTDTIATGTSSLVTVKLTGDTIGGFFQRHVDIFYNEKENPERILLHGFITDNHNTNH